MRRALALAFPLLLSAGCASNGNGASGTQAQTLKFSFPLAAGEEKTQCLVTHTDNASAFDFSRIDSHMTAGSHHLILYKDASDLTGQAPPVEGVGDCPMGAARLLVYATQDADHFDTMPPGVAGELSKHALVILEAHYVNASSSPITANVEVTLTPSVPGTVTSHAGIIFYLDTTFSVPPGAGINGNPVYTHETICPVPDGRKIFRMGSHTHKHGKDFQIFQRDITGNADVGMVYENTDWSNPAEKVWPDASPLELAPAQGFRFSCSWDNDSNANLTFGESVTDEMCIMGAGYYPRLEPPVAGLQGNIFCLDGQLYY